MAKSSKRKLAVGTRVYWHDPDDGACSGAGVIVGLQQTPSFPDTVIAIKKDDGAEVECLAHELQHEAERKPMIFKVWICVERENPNAIGNSREGDEFTELDLPFASAAEFENEDDATRFAQRLQDLADQAQAHDLDK